jgi:hypothetical protein
MRILAVAGSLLLFACGSSASTPEPVATTAPSSAAPPSSAPPTTVAPPVSVAPSITSTARVAPETSRAVAAAVREGRREAHAGHLPEALAAFDRALALVPGQPRVLCEAGFVAHRGGDEAGAARRIESALHAFGPPEHVSDAMRQPLAMCLYNRGLVAEAQHDLAGAARAYEASVALRPNATVSAAFARAREGTAAEPDDGATHVGGAVVEDDLVRVTSIEALLDVLRHGMRGNDENDEPLAPGATDVRVRATLHRPSSGAELAIIDVDDGDSAYRTQHLVIAERVTDGYRVGMLQVGAQDLMMSETEGDFRLLEATSRWEGDVLIVGVTTATNESSFDTVDGDEGGLCNVQITHTLGDTMAVFCSIDGGCTWVVTAHSDSGEDVYRECDDEEGTTEEGEPTSVSVRIHLEGTVVVAEGDTDDAILAPGRYPLADLGGDPLDVPTWVTD